tara:strand:+ start:1057 stop:1326 length:270 start_codon:yes stop_codon:yes gene_type:complete
MKTFVVLIPVDDSLTEPRKACEMIENTKFNVEDFISETITAKHVLKKVMLELGIETDHNIEVEPITDFMDRFNNEELNVDNYFMSYIYA